MTEKVLLVYATMSGNTEAMADLIEKGLTEAGAGVDRMKRWILMPSCLMITRTLC